MRIGVVSDTHGFFDPQLTPLLQGVDEVLHGGDVGSQLVLDQLRTIAPLHAVQGNVDAASLGLAPTVTRRFGWVEIHMLHQLPGPQSALHEWAQASLLKGKPAEDCRRFLGSLPAPCQVVIFGHSHEFCALILGGKLFFNPGSAGKKRFSLPRCCGLLEVSGRGLRATFLGLEGYNQNLPEGVWLPIEGAKACGNC
jgi:putative phosphoesterase